METNVAVVDAMILEYRRVRFHNIENALDTSYGLVSSIVHDQLGFMKVCAPWVPKLPTEVQKTTKWAFPSPTSHDTKTKEMNCFIAS
ncbi:hypothetical protein AVEN_42586-1 [Araneus ventricosus]|uniref:Uncharacterized protein n=1 Tax=Araneus ventricosus TaxID=182803 RepID=A0A4Y2PTR7_ARAVE|nr:hypothetical protein AVEN_42586-1 [Araneus ventricosus]